ncbi:hypothetical protein BSL78_12897 [Apostichopus japonicus]|uniref:Uncharacterized protein n=1 Tax=Stichopus japonicus TaxID=307972 RepID=A0A2G8KQF5_STIJA|nr:hypothetical protein BSL78_12897 [Apostichopus japonicus]
MPFLHHRNYAGDPSWEESKGRDTSPILIKQQNRISFQLQYVAMLWKEWKLDAKWRYRSVIVTTFGCSTTAMLYTSLNDFACVCCITCKSFGRRLWEEEEEEKEKEEEARTPKHAVATAPHYYALLCRVGKELLLKGTTTGPNCKRIPTEEVKSHAETLKGLQSNLITLTTEISRIDGDKNATYHQLKVQRNPPRLPAQLNHSEEFTDSWNQVLQRAGRNLRRIWREELSRQAKRQRDRFLEKRSRAETDLESTLEAPEAQMLLKTILQKSAKREETRVARRPKARNRKQPYKR